MECTKTWNTGLYDVTIGLLVSSACAAVYSWLPLDLTGKTTLPELPDAVVGGHEKGSPTYVARVMRDGFWELGKLNNWARFGYSVHGVEVEVPEGEVLVSNGAHDAVWVNAAFGEEAQGMISLPGPLGRQSVGRAWHKGRFIPGKVVHALGCLCFPFGGRELMVRKYQLLTTDFIWQPILSGAVDQQRVVRLDDAARAGLTDGRAVMATSAKPDHTDTVLQKTGDARAEWEISGDGDYVLHSIVSPSGGPLVRVWSECTWAQADFAPCTHAGRAPGAHLGGCHSADYHVLTACRTRGQQTLLSLRVGMNAVQNLMDEEEGERPPQQAHLFQQEIFVMTKLPEGMPPWTAVKEIMSGHESAGRDASGVGVRDHLQPMMPLIDELSRAEIEGGEADLDAVNAASRAAATMYRTSASPAQLPMQSTVRL